MFKLLKVTAVEVLELVIVLSACRAKVTDPPLAVNFAGDALLVNTDAINETHLPLFWLIALHCKRLLK